MIRREGKKGEEEENVILDEKVQESILESLAEELDHQERQWNVSVICVYKLLKHAGSENGYTLLHV